MFTRQRKRRYLRSVAKSYYFEQRKYKCLVKWRTAIKTIRRDNQIMRDRMKEQAPYAFELLLEKLAYPFYLETSLTISSQEVLMDCQLDPYIPDAIKFLFLS